MRSYSTDTLVNMTVISNQELGSQRCGKLSTDIHMLIAGCWLTHDDRQATHVSKGGGGLKPRQGRGPKRWGAGVLECRRDNRRLGRRVISQLLHRIGLLQIFPLMI